jgi:uncharacterized ubiquitin-like protein YukD
MTKRTYFGVLALVLTLWPCSPCAAASPQLPTSAPDEPALRVLDYDFRDVSIAEVIENIAGAECIKVTFDDSVLDYVRDTRIDLRLKKASPMRALAIVLDSQSLKYEYTNDRELVIFRGNAHKKVTLTSIVYSSAPLTSSLEQIGQVLHLKVLVHSSVASYHRGSITVDLRDVSLLRGLEFILSSRRLTYEYVDCGTIIVFEDQSTRLT